MEFWPEINKKFKDYNRNELIRRMVSAEFTKYPEGIESRKKLNSESDGNTKSLAHFPETIYDRFYINLGRKQKLIPENLIRLINEQKNDDETINIGKIEILNSFSFFEIERTSGKRILRTFENTMFENVQVKIQPSRKRMKSGMPLEKGYKSLQGIS